MNLRRLRPEPEIAGFSRWIRPIMQSYMMACCDCGLVHELQFYAVKVAKHGKDGYWSGNLLPRRSYRVMFRARRAPRYTAAQRKKKNAASKGAT